MTDVAISSFKQRLRFRLAGLDSRDLEQQCLASAGRLLQELPCSTPEVLKSAVLELLSGLDTSSKYAVKARLQLAEHTVLNCMTATQLQELLPALAKQANSIMAKYRSDSACINSLAAFLSSCLAKLLDEPQDTDYAAIQGYSPNKANSDFCNTLLLPIVRSSYKDPEQTRVAAGSVVLLALLEVLKAHAWQSAAVEAVRRCLELMVQLISPGNLVQRAPGALLPACTCLEVLGVSTNKPCIKRLLHLCLQGARVKDCWQIRRDALQTLAVLAASMQFRTNTLSGDAPHTGHTTDLLRTSAMEVLIAHRCSAIKVLKDAKYDQIAAVRACALTALAEFMSLPGLSEGAAIGNMHGEHAKSRRHKSAINGSSVGQATSPRAVAGQLCLAGQTSPRQPPRFIRPKRSPGRPLDSGIQIFAPPSPRRHLKAPAAVAAEEAAAGAAVFPELDQSPVQRRLFHSNQCTSPDRLQKSVHAASQTPDFRHHLAYTVHSPWSAAYPSLQQQHYGSPAGIPASTLALGAAGTAPMLAHNTLQLQNQDRQQQQQHSGQSTIVPANAGNQLHIQVSHQVHGRVELGVSYQALPLSNATQQGAPSTAAAHTAAAFDMVKAVTAAAAAAGVPGFQVHQQAAQSHEQQQASITQQASLFLNDAPTPAVTEGSVLLAAQQQQEDPKRTCDVVTEHSFAPTGLIPEDKGSAAASTALEGNQSSSREGAAVQHGNSIVGVVAAAGTDEAEASAQPPMSLPAAVGKNSAVATDAQQDAAAEGSVLSHNRTSTDGNGAELMQHWARPRQKWQRPQNSMSLPSDDGAAVAADAAPEPTAEVAPKHQSAEAEHCSTSVNELGNMAGTLQQDSNQDHTTRCTGIPFVHNPEDSSTHSNEDSTSQASSRPFSARSTSSGSTSSGGGSSSLDVLRSVGTRVQNLLEVLSRQTSSNSRQQLVPTEAAATSNSITTSGARPVAAAATTVSEDTTDVQPATVQAAAAMVPRNDASSSAAGAYEYLEVHSDIATSEAVQHSVSTASKPGDRAAAQYPRHQVVLEMLMACAAVAARRHANVSTVPNGATDGRTGSASGSTLCTPSAHVSKHGVQGPACNCKADLVNSTNGPVQQQQQQRPTSQTPFAQCADSPLSAAGSISRNGCSSLARLSKTELARVCKADQLVISKQRATEQSVQQVVTMHCVNELYQPHLNSLPGSTSLDAAGAHQGQIGKSAAMHAFGNGAAGSGSNLDQVEKALHKLNALRSTPQSISSSAAASRAESLVSRAASAAINPECCHQQLSSGSLRVHIADAYLAPSQQGTDSLEAQPAVATEHNRQGSRQELAAAMHQGQPAPKTSQVMASTRDWLRQISERLQHVGNSVQPGGSEFGPGASTTQLDRPKLSDGQLIPDAGLTTKLGMQAAASGVDITTLAGSCAPAASSSSNGQSLTAHIECQTATHKTTSAQLSLTAYDNVSSCAPMGAHHIRRADVAGAASTANHPSTGNSADSRSAGVSIAAVDSMLQNNGHLQEQQPLGSVIPSKQASAEATSPQQVPQLWQHEPDVVASFGASNVTRQQQVVKRQLGSGSRIAGFQSKSGFLENRLQQSRRIAGAAAGKQTLGNVAVPAATGDPTTADAALDPALPAALGDSTTQESMAAALSHSQSTATADANRELAAGADQGMVPSATFVTYAADDAALLMSLAFKLDMIAKKFRLQAPDAVCHVGGITLPPGSSEMPIITNGGSAHNLAGHCTSINDNDLYTDQAAQSFAGHVASGVVNGAGNDHMQPFTALPQPAQRSGPQLAAEPALANADGEALVPAGPATWDQASQVLLEQPSQQYRQLWLQIQDAALQQVLGLSLQDLHTHTLQANPQLHNAMLGWEQQLRQYSAYESTGLPADAAVAAVHLDKNRAWGQQQEQLHHAEQHQAVQHLLVPIMHQYQQVVREHCRKHVLLHPEAYGHGSMQELLSTEAVSGVAKWEAIAQACAQQQVQWFAKTQLPKLLHLLASTGRNIPCTYNEASMTTE